MNDDPLAIRTQRMVLRHPSKRGVGGGDWEALRRDPEIAKRIGVASLEKEIERWDRHGHGLRAAVNIETWSTIGVVGLSEPDASNADRGLPAWPHLLIALLPAHRRAGLGLEAARGLLSSAPEARRVPGVVAHVDADNQAGIGLVESLSGRLLRTREEMDLHGTRLIRDYILLGDIELATSREKHSR